MGEKEGGGGVSRRVDAYYILIHVEVGDGGTSDRIVGKKKLSIPDPTSSRAMSRHWSFMPDALPKRDEMTRTHVF